MKPLSRNNILNVCLFPILLFLIILLMMIDGNVPWISNPAVAIPMCIILIGWIYYGVKDTFDLFYDEEFLYLRGVIESKKIPLSRIEKVQRENEGMRVKGVTSWQYSIQFHQSANWKNQSFNEVDGGGKVPAFIVAVRRKNPVLLT